MVNVEKSSRLFYDLLQSEMTEAGYRPDINYSISEMHTKDEFFLKGKCNERN